MAVGGVLITLAPRWRQKVHLQQDTDLPTVRVLLEWFCIPAMHSVEYGFIGGRLREIYIVTLTLCTYFPAGSRSC